ncbi:hypothetical protein FGG78_21700 [Thioclava sp. BHET1]|nr:hypothetical protein FGG78_21700 [Thioclava sp. BHET1]
MQIVGDVGQAVSLEEFKRAVHLLEDDSDDDLRITACLLAAQEVVETATRRPMLPRNVTFTITAGPWLRWWFPVCPVVQITGLTWLAPDGTETALDLAGTVLRNPGEEPQLQIPEGYFPESAPHAELRIAASVGCAAAAVPLGMKQAVLLIAKEWFDAGVALDQAVVQPMTFAAETLIRKYRYKRPREFRGSGRRADAWGFFAEGGEHPRDVDPGWPIWGL